MTENMAGRGEGLAGLVAKWREAVRQMEKWPELQSDACVLKTCTEQLETALEAAAPAGTARTFTKINDYGVLIREVEQAQDILKKLWDQLFYFVPGSPRKVGEDGALKADDYRLVPVRLVQRFGANVPGNESDTRWTVCLPNGDYAHLFPEYLLSRPSSVPVGEQKQEEGV